jgi:hypothetical protein
MRQLALGLGVIAVLSLAGVTTIPAQAAGMTSPLATQLRVEALHATNVAWHPIRRVKNWWHGRRTDHARRSHRR